MPWGTPHNSKIDNNNLNNKKSWGLDQSQSEGANNKRDDGTYDDANDDREFEK